MAGFLKTFSTLYTKSSDMYFDFTTPKGLEITPSDEKK